MAENSSIVILVDDDIAKAIEHCVTDSIFTVGINAETYAECLEFSVKHKIHTFILQARVPITDIGDMLFEFQVNGLNPNYVIFERTAPNQINYAITVSSSPVVKAMEELFITAMRDNFIVRQINYRSTLLNDKPDFSIETAGRQESLLEILRGCNEQEFSLYREKYNLDLKDGGYYLFFWELMFGGFADHERNKFIYNFSGKLLLRECNDIICEYDGGEVFYSTPDLLCIIINDLRIKSESKKNVSFEELIQKLTRCTGTRTACRYISDRISKATDFREAYTRYHTDKSFSFFLRDMVVMRPSLIAEKKQPDNGKTVNALLQKIIDGLRYDLMNPSLDRDLENLYFGILKPAMSFTLYYSSVSKIDNAIEEVAYSIDGAIPNSNHNLLQFSSIEEQFEILISKLRGLREQCSISGRITNSVILKTLKYIADNYSRDISITDLSSYLFISGAYLSQIFKRQTGCGIKKYLISYRMEQAKKQLRETDALIYTISGNVGFHDFRHFSRSFKSLTGLSPTDYRKQFKTGEEKKKTDQA